MFVRYIEDKDVFEAGFILNPLFNETFSKEKIDTKYLSTYMQVWMTDNSYRYKVVTDREGVVEYGTIFSKEILQGLVSKFFKHDKVNFLRRNLKNIHDWNNKEIQVITGSLQMLPEEKIKEIMIKHFGENYNEIAA